jgi:hypothetical protein
MARGVELGDDRGKQESGWEMKVVRACIGFPATRKCVSDSGKHWKQCRKCALHERRGSACSSTMILTSERVLTCS